MQYNTIEMEPRTHWNGWYKQLFNIAAVEKRAITTTTQKYITGLNYVAAQLTVVTNGVSAYIASKGYIGAIAVQSQESNLDIKLGTAKKDFCAVARPISDEDTLAVIAFIGSLTTQIEAALAAIVSKKSVFGSVSLVTSLVKDDVTSLKDKTTVVSTCLVNSTPTAEKTVSQSYITRIDTAAVVVYA